MFFAAPVEWCEGASARLAGHKTEPQNWGGETVIRKKIGDKAGAYFGREGSSEKIGKTGRKEGDSEFRAAEIHARRMMRMNLGRGKVGNEVKRTGRKEGDGN